MTQTTSAHVETRRRGRQAVETIRPEGLYRWNEFADRIPYSRETWRQRVRAGTAPKPTTQTGACTAWRGADILAWLNDPVGYQADNSKH